MNREARLIGAFFAPFALSLLLFAACGDDDDEPRSEVNEVPQQVQENPAPTTTGVPVDDGIDWEVRSPGSSVWIHCDGRTAVYYSTQGALTTVDNSEHCSLG